MEKQTISRFLDIIYDDKSAHATCPAGDAARMIPPIIRFVKEDGTYEDYFLFVEEERQPCGKKIVNFPGGRLNKGEDALKAVIRELLEETGLNVSDIPIKMVMESKAKDPINSLEGESLFVCPQVVEVDASETKFVEMLGNNQNLDENEYCKIKLVSVSKIKDFLQTADMCLPTRLSLMWYLASKNKTAVEPFKTGHDIDEESVADLKPQTVCTIHNLTAKKVDVGFSYCYYTPVHNREVSVVLCAEVDGKKYYIFQQQNGLMSMPSYGFSHDGDCEPSQEYVEQVLAKFNLQGALTSCEQLTPFDAVSPGITDKRQCIFRATVKLTKQQLINLNLDEGVAVVSEQNLGAVVASADYMTALAMKYESALEKNKNAIAKKNKGTDKPS